MVQASPKGSRLLTLSRLKVTFIDKDGDEQSFEVSKGDNLLDIAQANDIEMEGMDFEPRNDLDIANVCHRCVRRVLRMLNVPCHCGRRSII